MGDNFRNNPQIDWRMDVFPNNNYKNKTPISLPDGMTEKSLIGMPLITVQEIIVQNNPTFTVSTNFQGGRWALRNTSDFVRIIYDNNEKVTSLSRS